MAFSSDIVVDDFSGDDVTYRLVSPDSRGGSRRMDIATQQPTPAYLILTNQVQGKGAAATDAYLVSITDTQMTTSGDLQTLVINLTVRVPRGGAFTLAEIKDRLYNVKNFLTEANIEALVRGEI